MTLNSRVHLHPVNLPHLQQKEGSVPWPTFVLGWLRAQSIGRPAARRCPLNWKELGRLKGLFPPGAPQGTSHDTLLLCTFVKQGWLSAVLAETTDNNHPFTDPANY